MAPKSEIACGIVESIADLRKGDELEDFTVIVDGVSVRCHRFILGACSLFFRALFRSEMKENEENCVTLKSVSHSTFTLILSALYTGLDVLTEENVIDVWHATHMLQIGFLVKECEAFVVQHLSLENYEEMYRNAVILNSKIVFNGELRFMAKNFNDIHTSQTFLDLPSCQMMKLIENDWLEASSEDVVIKAVVEWASNKHMTHTEKGDSDSDDDGEDKNEPARKKLKLNRDSGHEDQNIDGKQTHQTSSGSGGFNDSDHIGTTEKDNGLEERKDFNIQAETNLDLCSTETGQQEKSHDGDATRAVDFENNQDVQGRSLEAHATKQNYNTSKEASKKKQKRKEISPIERQKNLSLVMAAVRTCLVSPRCLEQILSCPIVADNPDVRQLVLNGLYYHSQTERRHGQWPLAAIHRRNSSLENMVLCVEKYKPSGNYHRNIDERDRELAASREVVVISHPHSQPYTSLCLTTNATTGELINFDNDLYEINYHGLYEFINGKWSQVLSYTFRGSNIAASCGLCIYFVNAENNFLLSVDPKQRSPQVNKHSAPTEIGTTTAAATFRNCILLFTKHNNQQSEEETVVHSFDTSNKSWTRLKNLNGPATGLISFCTEEDSYLLQTNGNLWKVTIDGSGAVDIIFCLKAWDFQWNLYGAVIFRNTLHIFGGMQAKGQTVFSHLPDMKTKVQCRFCEKKVSVTPIIMPKKYLKTE